ncbi:MAG TPA: hypothetical protein DCL21_01900 [Alphaproteobacteria bacterium]|nr:hypothetical protein [Alphaproteobacteria bacterium]
MFNQIKNEWSEMTTLAKVIYPLSLMAFAIFMYGVVINNPLIGGMGMLLYVMGAQMVQNDIDLKEEKEG